MATHTALADLGIAPCLLTSEQAAADQAPARQCAQIFRRLTKLNQIRRSGLAWPLHSRSQTVR